MSQKLVSILSPAAQTVDVVALSVQEGEQVQKGSPVCTYVTVRPSVDEAQRVHQTLKAHVVGIVRKVTVKEGDRLQPGATIMDIEEHCDHGIVVYGLCAICGLNLKSKSNEDVAPAANISVLPSILEVQVSQKEAEALAIKDKLRLLKGRRLALIVDLDQTLIHTSIDRNIEPGLPDVYGFTLPGHPFVYHCRLRPHTKEFLSSTSQLYEMYVCTMGTKDYASAVTGILDPERKFFCDRVISRDECFDPTSKALRLKSVFPCGDEMVAIIDDREDVWGCCPNLVHVKPYVFFAGTADINAPPQRPVTPSLSKRLRDPRETRLTGSPTKRSRPFVESKPLPDPCVPSQISSNPHTITQAISETKNTNNNNNGGKEKVKEDSSKQSGSSSGSGTSDSSSSSTSSSDSDSSSDSEQEEEASDNKPAEIIPLKEILEEPAEKIAIEKSTTVCDSTSPHGCNPVPPTETLPSSPPPQVETKSRNPTAMAKSTNTGKKEVPSHRSLPVINDPDNFLVYLADILKRIHEIFYTSYDSLCPTNPVSDSVVTPDLKEIIPKLRRSVLGSVKMAFTGVIPTDVPLENSREWHTARAFGAVVHKALMPGLNSPDPKLSQTATTHLVIGRVGTSKHKQSVRMPGIKLVNPLWLWSCAEQWKLVDEALFTFTPPTHEKSEKDVNGQGKGIEKKEEKWKKPLHVPFLSKEGRKRVKAAAATAGTAFNSRSELQFSMLGAVGNSPGDRSDNAERRFSVSSEELEKMEAEIDAQLSESSGSDEDMLGSMVEKVKEQSMSTESFDDYLGVSESSMLMQTSKQTIHADREDSSDSNSFDLSQSRSLEHSDDDEDESDSGDELAKLLGM